MSFNEPSENEIYKQLAYLLKSGNFTGFKNFVNKNHKFHLDPKLIPERFIITFDLLIDCLRNVPIDTSYLGKFIDILRWCNDLNIVEVELSEEDIQELKQIKYDNIFLNNLNDLFGKVTNSFIFYVYHHVPRIIYDFITKYSPQYFESTDRLAYYVKYDFINQFNLYGLSIKLISSLNDFLDKFDKEIIRKRIDSNSTDYFEFNVYYEYFSYYPNSDEKFVIVKRHLISPKLISRLKEKILLRDDYKFYNLSMVLLGGIGPQGHGFTYSTPKGEVIEICSDIKENDAIIVKYKQFLKQQFLRRLSEELKSFDNDLKNKLLNYLDSIFENQELIGYNKKSIVMSKIENYLSNFEEKLDDYILDKISNAITIILRPITMVDQFKCRIDLISQGKLKSEDIAKLTSLEDKRDKSKSKTHYDVLRERLFFQYVNDWFYELYMKKKKN